MEVIAEEGGENRPRKIKLKDPSDKEEGARGRPVVCGHHLFLLTLRNWVVSLRNSYAQSK